MCLERSAELMMVAIHALDEMVEGYGGNPEPANAMMMLAVAVKGGKPLVEVMQKWIDDFDDSMPGAGLALFLVGYEAEQGLPARRLLKLARKGQTVMGLKRRRQS